MTQDEALGVLGLLGDLEVTVGGGWGVDALVGRPTRAHADLDVYLRRGDLGAALHRLEVGGFVRTVDWLPGRLVLRHPDDREVDLHPYDPNSDGSARYAPRVDDVIEFPADAFVSGQIDGQEVSCWSAAFQLAVHAGYAPSEADLHDLAILAELMEAESDRPPPAPE